MKRFIMMGTISLSIAISGSLGYAANWIYYGESKSISIAYYDKQSLKYSKNKVRVWNRIYYSDFGKDRMIDVAIKAGLSVEYKNLEYSLSLKEYDCKDAVHRIITWSDYQNDGSVLSTMNNPSTEFEPIIPESIDEILMGKICK